MNLKPPDKRTSEAGRRACAQLVRAVSSAVPLRKAAAGPALARLHDLLIKGGYTITAARQPFEEVCDTASALVQVYSVSLREVARQTPTPGPSAAGENQVQLEESKDSPAAATPEPHAAEYGQQHPGRGSTAHGAESGCGSAGGGAAAGHGAGPFPEDWVPLLVDSSALVANCLRRGVFTIDPTMFASISDADVQRRATQQHACGTAMVSALLLSDALPALSRLLSTEAQRGPARALLTPRQLATCLQPLNELIGAAHILHDELLPVIPQGLRQPDPPAPNSPTTITTTTTSSTPAPSPMPPTPEPKPGTSAPPASGPSAATPTAASSAQAQTSSSMAYRYAAAGEPGCSAAVPVPHGRDPTASRLSPALPAPQTSQRLGAAILTAAAVSGVVEAACRAAVGAARDAVQPRRKQQPQRGAACVAGGDREQLIRHLVQLPRQLVDALKVATAGSMPMEPLRTILTGPCVQYVLAAHSVSQLHAVDGGTTYGLPYDSLMPPVRIEGKATLSCKGVMCALCWWINVCRFGGIPPLRSLSPRGLSELCLRKAEVAADCWRRRNGLPAAAAAAAAAKSGAAVDSGSGGKGASNSSGKGRPAGHGAGEDTGRQADLCRIGGAASTASGDSGSGAAADPHRATLDPRQCPTLAVQAVSCSLALMEISCGAGAGEAGARVSKGCGSGAGASGGTNNRMASPSGNTGVGEGDRETGGGSLDGQGACGGGSGDGTQEAAEHEEAGGSASVGVSGGGRAGQGGGADRGTNSGGCDSAVEEDYGSDSGSCHKHHFAWLANGGPLARRWWRAAVAAVHCALDELEAVGSIVAASFVDQVLDPSLAMPETDTGPALPAAPPAALSAALDAGYLPCLERTLRTCFRACNTPAEAVDVCRGVFSDDADVSWHLLLAFGDEREAAALLATAAKVARRACEERARPGGDRKACAAVIEWLEGMSSNLWRAADHAALRVAAEQGVWEGEPSASVQKQRWETAATGGGDGGGEAGGESSGCTSNSSGSGSSGGGDGDSSSDGRCVHGSAGDSGTGAGTCDREGGVRGGVRTSGGGRSDDGGGGERDKESDGCSDRVGGAGSGCGGSTDGRAAPPTCSSGGCGTTASAGTFTAASAATAATTAAAGSLSPPEQQLMRLLSFALPLWLPLWLDLAAAMLTDGRLTRSWRGEVHRAFDLLDLVQHLCVDATEKQDLLSADSWRSIVTKSRDEVEGMLDGCRRVLEREEAAARVASAGYMGTHVREEDGVTAEELYKKMEEVRETATVLEADLQEAMFAREEVEGGREGLWYLAGLGLLSPPCDARQLLPCCSNPRCAELAGDSEAGVVLRRCGGACGGVAAYCCAACQRACQSARGRGGAGRGRGWLVLDRKVGWLLKPRRAGVPMSRDVQERGQLHAAVEGSRQCSGRSFDRGTGTYYDRGKQGIRDHAVR